MFSRLLFSRISFALFAIAATLSSASASDSRTRDEADVIALHCGDWFDAPNAKLRGPAILVIEAGKVREILAPDASASEATRSIDLTQHTCLPGLMDMHVHLSNQYTSRSNLQRFTRNPTDYAIAGVVQARKTLMAGFTTVRDLEQCRAAGSDGRTGLDRAGETRRSRRSSGQPSPRHHRARTSRFCDESR